MKETRLITRGPDEEWTDEDLVAFRDALNKAVGEGRFLIVPPKKEPLAGVPVRVTVPGGEGSQLQGYKARVYDTADRLIVSCFGMRLTLYPAQFMTAEVLFPSDDGRPYLVYENASDTQLASMVGFPQEWFTCPVERLTIDPPRPQH